MTGAEHSEEEKERLVEEYKEVGNNMRQYGMLRFSQLGVFVAIVSGLAVVPSIEAFDLNLAESIGLNLLGIVMVFAFAVIEASSIRYWKAFRDRAKLLEGDLGFSQYTSGPEPRILSATFATYLVLAAFGAVFLVRLVSNLCSSK